MSLLDELAGLPLDQILQHLGPSLLTSPAIDTSPMPVDPGMSAGPMNARGASIGIPQMPAQATSEQMAAQQSPEYKAGFPGGRTLQKLLDAIAPVPEPYKQLLSGDEQRRMQLQSLGQIGGGLTGAYTRPGESQWFGQNLSRGLDASHAGMNQALAPTGQATELGNVIYQMHARQAIGQMFPQISEDPEVAQRQYLTMAKAAAQAGLHPESTNYTQMANSIKERQQSLQGAVAPAAWYDAYDKAHPAPEDQSSPKYTQWLRERANALTEAAYPGSANADRQLALNYTNERLSLQKEQGVNTRFGQGLDFRQGQSFIGRGDIKPMIAQSNAYAQTYSVLNQAFGKNPAAYKSTAGNLAQTLDQKGQLRTTLFQIFSEFDPSLKGKFETWYSKWKEGGYPQYQLLDVKQMLDEARAAAIDKYTAAAGEYQTAYPNAYIPDPETIFRIPAMTNAPGGATGPKKSGLTPEEQKYLENH